MNEKIVSMNRDYLLTLSFKDSQSAISHLRMLAERDGFKLSLKDSSKSDRIRLYCHKSSISKGKSNTHKTNCPFKISILKHSGNNETDEHIISPYMEFYIITI